MRMFKLLSWVLLAGMVGLFVASGRAQSGAGPARSPGHIVAVRVTGTVTATNLSTRVQSKLETNSIISQGYVVNTGPASSAILLLSNGASLNLGADSTLSIDEFLQDPLEQEVALSELTEEPTTSVTRLNLSRGELVGNVKKIHEDRGSSFTVNTPVGAAGIRGTTFRIVFRPSATGQAFFTLSTADGRVLFEAPISQQRVNVPTGQEVVVMVDVQVDASTGRVVVTAPPTLAGTRDIPPTTQAAIAVAAQQIIEAASSAIISSTQQAQADQSAAEKSAAEKAATDKAAAEKAAAGKAAAEKEAAEKAAADKSAADKAAADKAAADKSSADKSEQDQGGSKNNEDSNTNKSSNSQRNDETPSRFNPPPPPPPPPQQQTTSGDGRAT